MDSGLFFRWVADGGLIHIIALAGLMFVEQVLVLVAASSFMPFLFVWSTTIPSTLNNTTCTGVAEWNGGPKIGLSAPCWRRA